MTNASYFLKKATFNRNRLNRLPVSSFDFLYETKGKLHQMDKSFKKWLRGTFINPIHFQKLASICLICEFIFAAAVSYCPFYLGAYRQRMVYYCLGHDELFFDFDYFITGGYNRSAGDFGLNFCQVRHLTYFCK